MLDTLFSVGVKLPAEEINYGTETEIKSFWQVTRCSFCSSISGVLSVC